MRAERMEDRGGGAEDRAGETIGWQAAGWTGVREKERERVGCSALRNNARREQWQLLPIHRSWSWCIGWGWGGGWARYSPPRVSRAPEIGWRVKNGKKIDWYIYSRRYIYVTERVYRAWIKRLCAKSPVNSCVCMCECVWECVGLYTYIFISIYIYIHSRWYTLKALRPVYIEEWTRPANPLWKYTERSNGVLGNGVEKYIDVLTELSMFLRSKSLYI